MHENITIYILIRSHTKFGYGLDEVTGPGPGKIRVNAHVYLIYGSDKIIKLDPCDVYIHVKGYSRARVTHVDVETPRLTIPNIEGVYAIVYGVKNGFRVILKRYLDIMVNNEKIVMKGLIIKWNGPQILSPGQHSYAYLGFKEGGIFIGFRKEVINRLEEFAIKKGIRPR